MSRIEHPDGDYTIVLDAIVPGSCDDPVERDYSWMDEFDGKAKTLPTNWSWKSESGGEWKVNSKTWTGIASKCSCTESRQDDDCPAAGTIFCGYYKPEDDPSADHQPTTEGD